MDNDELIKLMNRVPDVLSFSGAGHGRLFDRKTKPRQATRKEIEKGDRRRRIEEIEERRMLDELHSL